MNKDTSEQQIINHLAGICKVDCKKLVQRNSDRVASFRICAPFEKRENILDGKVWPKGTLVNRYFFPRRNREPGSTADLETKSTNREVDFLNTTIVGATLG